MPVLYGTECNRLTQLVCYTELLQILEHSPEGSEQEHFIKLTNQLLKL